MKTPISGEMKMPKEPTTVIKVLGELTRFQGHKAIAITAKTRDPRLALIISGARDAKSIPVAMALDATLI